MYVKIEIIIDRDGPISRPGLGEIDEALGEMCQAIEHVGSVSASVWQDGKRIEGQLAG